MSGKSSGDYAKDYTKPALREKLKEQIKASDKGGRKGQWSARKSQLLTAEYEKQGGGYKHAGKRSTAQKHLEKWTQEKWQTSGGGARARRGKTTERYLPADAWEQLSPKERKKTNAKKRRASRKGEQFVANTEKAKAARRAATSKSATKAELYEKAKDLKIPGRSKMSTAELRQAIKTG